MQRDSTPLVLDISDGGSVVAIIRSGEPTDDVLRQAIAAAAARAGRLVVIQFSTEPSAVRRALAKAILKRDVIWWSKGLPDVAGSVEELDDGSLDDSAAFVRGAACIVMSVQTACSSQGMAVLRRRTSELVDS